MKLEEVKTPHTLGGASYILFEYIDPTEVGADINLTMSAEVELRKPRNLFVCVREEPEDGERGEREGEGTQALSLSSGTHRIQNSICGTVTSLFFKKKLFFLFHNGILICLR